MMKACTMANGAVFFIPDEIEREIKSVSYTSLLEDNAQETPIKRSNIFSAFFKRERATEVASHAA